VITGTADLSRLAEVAPTTERLAAEPLVLEGVEILQVAFEVASAGITAKFPPGLHPTIPTMVTWLVWHSPGGALGEFSMAQMRLSCRSGVRPRGFLVSAIVEGGAAAKRLSSEWGYRCLPGEVRLVRGYDQVSARVLRDGQTILDVAILDPDPLRNDDVQYTANMNLARTPKGLRLVQVDPDHAVKRAERGTPRLAAFDGAGWEAKGVHPQDAVAGSFAVADVTLPRIRYFCRPEVTAFEGTETVA